MSSNHTVVTLNTDQIKVSVNDVIKTRLGKSGMFEEMNSVPFSVTVPSGAGSPFAASVVIQGTITRFGNTRFLNIKAFTGTTASGTPPGFSVLIPTDSIDNPVGIQERQGCLRLTAAQSSEGTDLTTLVGSLSSIGPALISVYQASTGLILQINPTIQTSTNQYYTVGTWPAATLAGADEITLIYTASGNLTL